MSSIALILLSYEFGTDDKIACYIPEMNEWYLEFPEEITVTY